MSLRQRDRRLLELDWSIHGDQASWPVTSHVFLAHAARILGGAMFGAWPDDDRLLQWAGEDMGANIPSADLAFHADESRLPHYDEHVAIMRRLRIALNDGIDEFPDGDLTYDEWADIQIDAEWRRSMSEAARRAAVVLARSFAELAHQDAIVARAIPIGPGTEFVLTPGDWEVADPIHRFASCGLDAHAPRDGLARPTHMIVFEERPEGRKTLQRVFQEHAAANYHHLPRTTGFRLRRRQDDRAVTAAVSANGLLELLRHPDNRRRNRDWFENRIVDLFGSGAGGTKFDENWKEITSQVEFKWRSLPGPK